jgi:hypothetical protein
LTAGSLVRSHLRTLRGSRLELTLAAILLLGTTAIGLVYGVAARPSAQSLAGGHESALGTLVWILQRNIPAALLLFSGVVTFGLTALAGGAGIGLFLGHSMALSIVTFGPAYVLTHTVLYTPVELYGFVLAFAAGLTPISLFVKLRERIDRKAVGDVMHRALVLLGTSVGVLVLGAFLEMANILLTA